MVADNPVDIVVAHVGQCNIVSLQEGQTRIVILKIQRWDAFPAASDR